MKYAQTCKKESFKEDTRPSVNGGFSSQGQGFGGLQGQLWRMACVSHNAACLPAGSSASGRWSWEADIHTMLVSNLLIRTK